MQITKQYELSEIQSAAGWLLEQAKGYTVIALHGAMGAGKTTLVRAICQQLQVIDVVSSPTFSVINEYRYRLKGEETSLYHIDLYRLDDEQAAIRAGVEDCLYSGDCCFVEWPERAPNLLPPGTLHVSVSLKDANQRRLEIAQNELNLETPQDS